MTTCSPASFFLVDVSMMVGQARPPKSSEVVSLFGIAADQQDLLALLGHHVGEIGEGEALADAALAVDRDDLRFLRRSGRNGSVEAASARNRWAGGLARSTAVKNPWLMLIGRLSNRGPSSGRKGR